MKVLLALHHEFDERLGAPGVTLGLARALVADGCDVDLFGYDEAFSSGSPSGVGRQVLFPWAFARHMAARADRYDVVDVSTGDNWIWTSIGRPGTRARHASVTRSHGLEHVADERTRALGGVSWRYPIYHGGYRLWEVARSIRDADHTVVGNDIDRSYCVEHLRVDPRNVTTMPNGVPAAVMDTSPPVTPIDGPVRLAFVGTWIERKGTDVLLEVIRRLNSSGIEWRLHVLGASIASEAVLNQFEPADRKSVSVTERFERGELALLLRNSEVLLFPSRSEGFSLALLECMSCGLVPIATKVGGAPQVIRDGIDGFLIDIDDAASATQAVARLARDRSILGLFRRSAYGRARAFDWDAIAKKTISLYERVIRQKAV